MRSKRLSYLVGPSLRLISLCLADQSRVHWERVGRTTAWPLIADRPTFEQRSATPLRRLSPSCPTYLPTNSNTIRFLSPKNLLFPYPTNLSRRSQGRETIFSAVLDSERLQLFARDGPRNMARRRKTTANLGARFGVRELPSISYWRSIQAWQAFPKNPPSSP